MEYTINSMHFPRDAVRIFPDQVVETAAKGTVELDRAMGGEAKYGKLHLREDIKPLFEGWLAPHPLIEYVPAEKSVGIMIPVEGRYHPANIAGTTINDSIIELNMRDVGKYISLEYNFREHFMDFMRNEVGYELVAQHEDLFNKARGIHGIAIGFLPEQAIYGIKELPNGEVVIYANKDAYKKVALKEEATGIKAQQYIWRGIVEELLHHIRKSKPTIKEEENVRFELVKLYQALADKTSDAKLKEQYNRILEDLREDIATIGRYAELYHSDKGKLELMLEAEVIMEEGETDEGRIRAYVSEKLEEIAKAADKEYLGEDGTAEMDAEMSKGAEKAESAGESAEGEACATAEDGGNGGGAPESGDGGPGDSCGGE